METIDNLSFESVFNLADIQQLQNEFSAATGVASIITHPDGTPITKPSNFSRLCGDIIRKTEKGCANCYKSDALLGKFNAAGPNVMQCKSGGLWDAGTSISVGGKHVANWLIGQVRDNTQTEQAMREYALEIGADEELFLEAFREVPAMPREQFERIAQVLFTLAKQLSDSAYLNMQQALFIKERKQAEKKLIASEEKWNTLFSVMTEMVALHDVVFNEKGEAVNYRITDCNNTYTAITGIKREDAIGKLATEVYKTEEPPYLAEFSTVAISRKPYEYATYYAPMDKHFLISVVSPQEGKFATITTDITAIKKIEEVISTKNKELENYLYVASHDLRSPLVNIQGFSQLLKGHTDAIRDSVETLELDKETRQKLDGIFKEEIPKTLDFIYTNVAKMDNLIKGLLQISRTGRVAMSIKQLNMNELIEKVLDAQSFEINEYECSAVVEDLPPCFGDYNLLNQLFSNIISNAIKYRHKLRKPEIVISAKTIYNQVIYIVKDNGIGIAERHLERIWDVFYRVNPRASESGDGIGLSIVKRIAEKHKGKVRLESEEGVGSTFYIELQKKTFTE